MAALGACRCGCTCRLLKHAATRQNFATRFLSAKPEQELVSSQQHKEQNLSSRKQKRDHLTVLKALSSTVSKVPGAAGFGFFEDAFLTPRSDYTKREYAAALESGRNAAEFVIKKYPELCNLREPVPAWPDEYVVFVEKEDEETFNFLVKTERIEEAVKLYETLQQNGVTLQLETLNSFLDFVGYHGVGVVDNAAKEPEADEGSSSSSSSESGSSSEEDGEGSPASINDKGSETYGFKKKQMLLSVDGYATKVFMSMAEKNAETYEAYILALLKHGEFTAARQYHNEMRQNNLKGSAYLYQQLIDNLDSEKSHTNILELWDLAEEFLVKMKEDGTAIPTVGIYNSLLKLASRLGSEAPSKAGMVFREMVANGIEPSLGSYLYILDANDANKSDKFALLVDSINTVYNRPGRLQVHDLKDLTFFSAAMNMARGFGNAELAKQLYATAKRDGNWALLGTSTSAFLGNYIAALARGEMDVEFVFAEYERLVPTDFVPRDWVFGELFKRLERGERPKSIFKLCHDMKINRVRLTFDVCEKIFSVFATPFPKELHKECLDSALEMMKWMSMFDIPVTGPILGQVARLYAMNGMLSDAWDSVKLFEEKGMRPAFSMMSALLDGAAEVKDEKFAFKSMKKMAEYNYWLTENQMQMLYDKLELSVEARAQFDAVMRSR